MKKTNITHNSGKRKSAVARATMKENGTGRIYINNKLLEVYYSSKLYRDKVLEPIYLLGFETVDKYDIFIKVQGGGISGQSEAIRVAISKCISKFVANTKEKLFEYELLK